MKNVISVKYKVTSAYKSDRFSKTGRNSVVSKYGSEVVKVTKIRQG